ncbi:MAG: toll/interleukin-1 receptor domain-containing protein [Methanophagales archaeon]|nr:toll/interleukin-1 receptor domain-containing protein [Methanophagales archaeon]
MMPMHNKAFLSYQEADKEFVEALGSHLRRNGVDVFFDKWDIRGGDSVPHKIEEALVECNLFLYVLSPAATKSKWVQQEYHAFLYRKINDHSLRIVPILRKTCERPPFVAPLHYIDFRESDPNDSSNFSVENEGPFKELLESIFRVPKKPPIGLIHPAFASYEFYFQPLKGNPKDVDGTLNYEIGFKNITDSPLHNFIFTLIFREPVLSVRYDFSRSSANMTGGDGLTHDGKRFSWLGNQLIEGGGWAVFIIKSKTIPDISKISTKLVGRVAGTNQVIPPDPNGI